MCPPAHQKKLRLKFTHKKIHHQITICIAQLLICQDLRPVHQIMGKSGWALYLGGYGCHRCHAGDSTDDTLAFEDAQVIPPLSREDTYLGHIWDIFGRICDISGTFLGNIWDIPGTYLGPILGIFWA